MRRGQRKAVRERISACCERVRGRSLDGRCGVWSAVILLLVNYRLRIRHSPVSMSPPRETLMIMTPLSMREMASRLMMRSVDLSRGTWRLTMSLLLRRALIRYNQTHPSQ